MGSVSNSSKHCVAAEGSKQCQAAGGSSTGIYSFGASFLKTSVPELRGDFDVPPHLHALHNESSLQDPYLFLGGAGSGLGFHVHGHAWNAVVFGRKLWLVYPPGWRHAALKLEQTALDGESWLREIYPKVANTSAAPFGCVTEAGDLLYVPPDWLHATVNLEPTIGVAVNLDNKDEPLAIQEPLQFHFDFNPRPSLERIEPELRQHHTASCGSVVEMPQTEECITASIELGLCLASEEVYGQELSNRVTEMGGKCTSNRRYSTA